MAQTIILSGKSGHGKDTFANFFAELARKDNKRVMIIHYGDLVKYFCKEFYNWNGEKDEYGRYLLQHIGTDVVRATNPDYWANCVAQFCATIQKEWDYILIPDARFPNEITITQKYLSNSCTIRIIRYENGEKYKNPLLTEAQYQHPSETSLDNYRFDFIIENFNNSLEFLQTAAKNIYMRFNKCY